MTAATWYKLGTLTLVNATAVRTFQLQLTTQSPVGVFRSAVVRFSSNSSNFVQNTYDTTPIAFNAYVQTQTTSTPWWYGTLSTDIAVTQLSNSSYAFYLKVYPDAGTGFFSVEHSTGGDSFLFEGVYTGTTRPANGIHPDIAPLVTAEQIGALPTGDPTATGLLTCQNFRATGTVDLPNDSLSISDVSGLQASLLAKANVTSPTFFGTVTLPNFQALNNPQLTGTTNSTGSICANLLCANNSFTTTYGTQGPMSAGVSSTIYTLSPNTRGLIFMDTDSTNASSCVAYFSNMSGVNYLSILARNGNAFSAQNIGANFGGTWNMTCVINSSGNIRVSVTNAGSIRWNVVLFSVVV